MTRCFQRCVTDVDKKQMETFLNSKVAKAVGEEMLWMKNWDEEPIPVQLEEARRSHFPYSVPPPVTPGCSSEYKYNSVPPPVTSGYSSAYKFNSQAGGFNLNRMIHNSERRMTFNQVTRKPVAILSKKTDSKSMILNGRSGSTQIEMKSQESSGILHRSQHLRRKEEILRREEEHLRREEEHLRRGEEQLSVIKKENNRKRSTSREWSSLLRGRKSPSRGRTSPSRGRTSPLRGRTSPSRGRASPLRGRTSPSRGRTSPLRGRTSPLRGRRSPSRGRASPPWKRERRSKLSGIRSRSCRRKMSMSQGRRSRSRGRRSSSSDRFQEREKGRQERKMKERLPAEKKDRGRKRNERLETWKPKREATGNEGDAKKGCQTCTRRKHGENPCPALGMDCFDCGQIGHLCKSAACKKYMKSWIDSRKSLQSVDSWDSTSELVNETRDGGHVELVELNTKVKPFGGKENSNVVGSIAPMVMHEVVGSIAPMVTLEVPLTATATTEDPEADMESTRQRQKEHEHLRQKIGCIGGAILPEVKTREAHDDLNHQAQKESVKSVVKVTPFGGKVNVLGSVAPIQEVLGSVAPLHQVLGSIATRHEVPHTATTEDPLVAMECSQQGQEEREHLGCIMSGEVNSGAMLPKLVEKNKAIGVQDDLDHQAQEELVKSTAKVTPFGGKGNVLGSISTVATLEPPPEIQDPEEAATEAAQIKADEPVTSVQVRLVDGSRMVVKLNHSHTVEDLRTFIITARPQYNGVPFSLVTTIPWLEPSLLYKELTENQQTLREAEILGAAILQRLK